MTSIRGTLAIALLAAACGSEPVPESKADASDSAFTALQDRGASLQAMGVDQYTSTHRFDDLPDGGRIELQRQVVDSAGVEQIRAHLRHIAEVFAQGDFRIPGFVHDTSRVPGTDVMRARRAGIEYEFAELPLGGEVRIRSTDAQAVQAIHTFLAFQRGDHRAGGHSAH